MKTRSGKTNFLDSLRLFWKLLAKDIPTEKTRLTAGFIFALVTGIFVMMIPHIIQLIVDNAIPSKNPALLFYYTLGLLGIVIVSSFCWYAQVSLISRASENIFYSFKLRLSDSLLKKQLSFFSRYQSSDLLTRMVSDLGLISEFFYKYLLKSLAEFVFVTVFLIYMLILNWRLSLIALVGIFALGVVMSVLDEHIKAKSALSRSRMSEQNDRMLDMLHGFREIRFFQQYEKMRSHVESSFKDYAEANFRFLRIMGTTEFLLETSTILIIFLPVVIGGYAIIKGVGGFTVGLVIAFQTYLIILSDGINKVFIGLAESIKITPAIERLQELLDYAAEEPCMVVEWDHIPDKMTIEFKNVSFSYREDRPLIADFNLQIDPGEKLCIMGQSGSGKTTVANLILRFLTPSSGEITLGNADIGKYPLNSYLSFFSYVWQDTYLFKLSVKENVVFGWFNVPDSLVYEALAQVGLKEVIESLPEKYETVIGKDGINFSGGQRQRLALARALVRGPEILLLDEFTSALDSELEQKMLDDIFALFKNQTIICITHSEQVAKRFDRIVRL